MKPTISILTPTWNRAEYLYRVWDGLVNQTFKSFEWIVANDGSDDNTIEVVNELAMKSDFPITLINASVRVGKSRMDNEAVHCANGEFILWCDSDDYLYSDALEVLLATWNSINIEERNDFKGVTALCETMEEGILGRKYPEDEYTDIEFNQLLNHMRADLVIFTKADLLKENPFLEVDFLISESSVWNILGVKKTRFIPRVLERKTYREPHCLSYSGLMEYNRGKAYAMAVTECYLEGSLSIFEKMKRRINYLRYVIHGEVTLLRAIMVWSGSRSDAFILPIYLPFSYILVLKDHLQGKVRKSHRQFNDAIKQVKIKTIQLND
ncbi:glycosyltransferase family 2 protein [Solemya elarraichensis gill symbiont]|nr:glycosyltransferase family 2 protein [Solemya elarraichensis gill symbiont]